MRFLPALLLACAALGGCSTPSIESSPLASSQALTPPMVVADDVLDLRFLRRPLPQTEPYRIGIGDKLRVNVFGHEALTQDAVLVLPDGYISLPLIARLKADGMLVEQIAAEIAALYRAQQIRDPDVTVSVQSSGGRLRDFLESVSGGSGQQGVLVPVEQDGTVSLPAVPPVTANRPFNEVREDIQAAYAAEFGPELAVVVRVLPRESPLAYVLGEVTTPGPIELRKDTNPLIAIARAGGFAPGADLEKVRVFRFSAEGQVDQWEINLAQSLENGQHDEARIPILARDVIFVPKTGVAVANEIVRQYIRNMLPTQVGFGIGYGLNQTGNN
ncbi:MAG: polysaccharide biosynthesis/export family protein [Gammaproteobacteria bacterium]